MRTKNAPAATRSPIVRRAGAVCLICTLAACSSAKTRTAPTTTTTMKASTTTTTTSSSTTKATLPSPATVAAVRAYFAHDGKVLLTFEHATAAVDTGSAPTNATCLRLTRDVLPKVVKDPNTLDPIATRIPEPTLASAFSQAVRLKLLLVQGCGVNASRGIPPITGAEAEGTYARVRDFDEGVKRLLAPYGLGF